MSLPDEPDYEYEFLTRGWDHLEKGDTAEAMRLFREALKVNPDCDNARQGMYQAVQRHYWGYRVAFGVVNGLAAGSVRVRIAVVVAILVGHYLLTLGLERMPNADALLRASNASLILLFMVAVTLKSWLVAAMIPHRFARAALNPEEVREGAIIFGLALIAIPAHCVGVLTRGTVGVITLYLSNACVATIFLLIIWFRTRGWQRWLLVGTGVWCWAMYARVMYYLSQLNTATNAVELNIAGRAMLNAADGQLGFSLAAILLASVLDLMRQRKAARAISPD